MKPFLLYLALFYFPVLVKAQSCLPGGITFSSQAEIDAFPTNYPGCTTITGHLIVDEQNNGTIFNVDSLLQLVSISGGLIIRNNTTLLNLEGLTNLSSISQSLQIESNNSLLSLEGLNSLNSIGYSILIMNNDQLVNLTGLTGIDSIPGFLNIDYNDGLLSLEGLEALSYVGESMHVDNNSNLPTLNGLEELTFIGDGFTIFSSPIESLFALGALETINGPFGIANSALTDFSGMESLIHVGALNVLQNNYLTGFGTGLLGIDSIPGLVTIMQNPLLPNLDGLDSIIFIGSLLLSQNPLFSDFTGFDQLMTIGGDLNLNQLHMLSSFNGLNLLHHIGGSLLMSNIESQSPLLTDFTGFNALVKIEGAFIINNLIDLESFNGLGNLEQIDGDFILANIENLVDFSGLSSLELIGGTFRVVNVVDLIDGDIATLDSIGMGLEFKSNGSLLSLSGFDSLVYLGGNLLVEDNPGLDSIVGLSSLTQIGGRMDILNNLGLKSISGFGELLSINGRLNIINNDSLQHISAFTSLNGINGNLELSDNLSLEEVTSFSSLEMINGLLKISGSYALNSLSGLDNIDPTTISHLTISACDSLSECALPNICTYLENNGQATIYNNEVGCANVAEVEFYCNPALPPCTALTIPVNGSEDVALDANLTWTLNPPVTTGYVLDIGTTPGGSELLDSFDVGNTNFYNPPFYFPPSAFIYITISPYNVLGENTSCIPDSFRTVTQASWIGGTGMWNVAANWDINAIPNDTTHVIILEGSVTIPSSFEAVAGSIEIGSLGDMHVGQNASLSINHPGENDAFVVKDSAAVLNQGLIEIGDLAEISGKGISVSDYGEIINVSSGILKIDQMTGPEDAAIHMIGTNTTIRNSGQIVIGSTTFIQSIGINLLGGAALINESTGVIMVDHVSGSNKDAIHLEGNGHINNAGDIQLGSNAPINRYGISLMNSGDFTNSASGSISIDQAQVGIYVFGFGSLAQNEGEIHIGNTGAISSSGILLSGVSQMINDTAATLYIDQSLHGIAVDNQAQMTNFGTLHIGDVLAISSNAINLSSGGDIYNHDTGIMDVNRSNRAVLATGSGSWFVNEGTLHIGNGTSLNNGISVVSSAFFNNQPSGQVDINAISTNHAIEALTNAAVSNFGSIEIGVVSAINKNGINLASGGDFNNFNGALLEINRCLDKGISMTGSGSIFTNNTALHIGNIAPVTNIGIEIVTSSLFTNASIGSVQINNVPGYAAIVLNGLAIVNNAGSISLGNVTNINGGIISWASGKFNNQAGGMLEINRVSWISLLVDQSGTLFTNNGTFKIGNLALTNEGLSLTNGGDLINTISGNMEVNQITYSGVQITQSGSVFTNQGNVTIGSTGPIGYNGIFVGAGGFLANAASGTIQINSVLPNWWSRAIFISAASFSNAGAILIGNTALSTAAILMEAAGTFTNTSTGSIVVDRTTNAGIELTQTGTTFTNQGSLSLGASGTIGTHGIQVGQGTSFANSTTGNVQINNLNLNWWSGAIYMPGGNFTNAGLITLGNLTTNSMGIAMESGAHFMNSSSGAIQINQTALNGVQIIHSGTFFTNQGSLTIGNSGAIGDNGILVVENGLFSNTSSGSVQINNANQNWWTNAIQVTGGSSLSNSGLIHLGNLASNNTGIFVDNGGSITNADEGTITNSNSTYNAVLVNLPGSSFNNNGDLFIGNSGGLMENAMVIQSGSALINGVTGNIEINRANAQWWSKSIAVIGSSFSNTGSVQIGNLSLNSFGVHAEGGSTITNASTGSILINKVTYQGIQLIHSGTLFTNNGLISTGATQQVGDNGIGLFENSTMTNAASGIIECNGGTSNGFSSGLYISNGSFNNNGLIRTGTLSPVNIGIRIGNSATEIGTLNNQGIIEIDRVPNTSYMAGLGVVPGSTFTNQVNGILKLGMNQNVEYGMYGGGTISNYGLIQTRFVVNGTVDLFQTVTNYSGGIMEVLAPGTLILESLSTLNNNVGSLLRSHPGAYIRIRGIVYNNGLIEAQ